MNVITPFDRFDSRFEQLFPDLFRSWAKTNRPALDAEIAVDIDEHEKEYVVKAEIPGATKEHVQVSVDGNFVSISADVAKDEERKEGRTLVRETASGRVARGFTLASDIDDKAATASLKDGVLKLVLPKRNGASSRRLTIG